MDVYPTADTMKPYLIRFAVGEVLFYSPPASRIVKASPWWSHSLRVIEIILYPKIENKGYFSAMETLSPSVIKSFNLGLEKLTGHGRRAYVAALAVAHFDGSARKAKQALSVSR